MGRPPKDAFDEATVSRVLRAAEETFGARGFKDSRLEDIASAASIRRPSLLYHFRSKDALYQEVVRRAFAELRQVASDPIAGDGSFEERLEKLTLALLSFSEQRPALLAVIIRALLDDREAGRSMVREEFIPLIDLVEAFVRSQGSGTVPKGTPVRAAIIQLFITRMVMAASGELQPAIWPDGDQTMPLMRSLLMGSPESEDSDQTGESS